MAAERKRLLTWVAFSVWFYALFVVFSMVAIPLLTALVAVFALFASRRRVLQRFRRAISWYGWIIIRVLPLPVIRVRYQDEEPLQGLAGSIVICNHRSASDPFLMACLPVEAVQVVNTWPMHLPVLGFFAHHAGYLSIREMEPAEFLDRGARLLADGVAVLAFPEGTRSGGKTLGPFHGMLFRLALRSRVPIVPLCISGNENNPGRGSWLLRPGVIRLHKLPAILPGDYAELDAYHLKNRVRERIAARLAEMDAAA